MPDCAFFTSSIVRGGHIIKLRISHIQVCRIFFQLSSNSPGGTNFPFIFPIRCTEDSSSWREIVEEFHSLFRKFGHYQWYEDSSELHGISYTSLPVALYAFRWFEAHPPITYPFFISTSTENGSHLSSLWPSCALS